MPVLLAVVALDDVLFGFAYLIVAVIVLFFSLGPADIGGQVDDYCEALEEDDQEAIRRSAKAIVERDVTGDAGERAAQVESGVCIQANNRLFAVIFWFIVFGPLGAWGYRATDLIRRRAVFNAGRDEEEGRDSSALVDAATTLHGWLAWLPARLTALGYALAGSFDGAIAAWRAEGDASGHSTLSEQNERLLAAVGAAALALTSEPDESAPQRGIRGAMAANGLVMRLLGIWAFVIAAMTLYGAFFVTRFWLAGLLAVAGCAEPMAPEDSSHESVRLVALAPHIAELVFAAGAGERLVAVSEYSDFPNEVTELPKIGDAFAIDLERLALIEPDVLLAWESGTPATTVEELRRHGYRVEVLRTRSLKDVALALRAIGALAHTQELGQRCRRPVSREHRKTPADLRGPGACSRVLPSFEAPAVHRER